MDSLRSVRAELLERTVKRDRKVDTLQRKVKALGEALETEQKVGYISITERFLLSVSLMRLSIQTHISLALGAKKGYT